MHSSETSFLTPLQEEWDGKIDRVIDILLALLDDEQLDDQEIVHTELIAIQMGLPRFMIDRLFESTFQTLSDAYMLNKAGVETRFITQA